MKGLTMQNKKEILKKRFSKLEKHYNALKEYTLLIQDMIKEKNIYDPFIFNTLKVSFLKCLMSMKSTNVPS